MSDDKQYSEEEIEIPDNAFVPCPKTDGFSLVAIVRHCPECEYWQGFYQLEVHGRQDIAFKKKYSVKCSHPVSREIIEVKL